MIKEKFVMVGENKIRYLEDGKSSDSIILVHGLGASAERWKNTIPYLGKKYHVVVPDLIGFGLSDKPLVDYTMEFFVKFFSEFIDNLEIQKTVMVGSSLGGQIVAELAISMHRSIDKVVLVSPSGIVNYSTPSLDAYIAAALSPNYENAKKAFQMMAGPNKEIDPQTVDDFVKRINMPNAKMAFMSAIISNKESKISCEKLANVSIPSLVLWGELDSVIPKENANQFFLCIKNCQFVEMKGCGHTPFVERPLEFSKIVLEFLNN